MFASIFGAASSHAATSASGLWGDGFEHDGFSEILAVDDWRSCAADEYIRVFPRLISPGRLPDCLNRHIKEFLAVWLWRCFQDKARDAPVRLRSIDASAATTVGRCKQGAWFPQQPHWRQVVLREARAGGPASLDVHAALIAIDELLCALDAGDRPAYDVGQAARFAFWTGVHPVYVWPQALLSHQLFTTIGWLGHCARGRCAVLPPDIAEFLLDSIVKDRNGGYRVSDPILERYMCARRWPRRLHALASRRQGLAPIFHPGFSIERPGARGQLRQPARRE
jgi:hypothetical protein